MQKKGVLSVVADGSHNTATVQSGVYPSRRGFGSRKCDPLPFYPCPALCKAPVNVSPLQEAHCERRGSSKCGSCEVEPSLQVVEFCKPVIQSEPLVLALALVTLISRSLLHIPVPFQSTLDTFPVAVEVGAESVDRNVQRVQRIPREDSEGLAFEVVVGASELRPAGYLPERRSKVFHPWLPWNESQVRHVGTKVLGPLKVVLLTESPVVAQEKIYFSNDKLRHEIAIQGADIVVVVPTEDASDENVVGLCGCGDLRRRWARAMRDGAGSAGFA